MRTTTVLALALLAFLGCDVETADTAAESSSGDESTGDEPTDDELRAGRNKCSLVADQCVCGDLVVPLHNCGVVVCEVTVINPSVQACMCGDVISTPTLCGCVFTPPGECLCDGVIWPVATCCDPQFGLC